MSALMYRQTIDPTHRRQHDLILSDTTQQVKDQLVIVSKLRIQNDRYLTDIEKGWIDSIITSATTVIGKLDIPDYLATERDEPRRNCLNSPAFLQQTKNTIQASPIAAQNLTQLLIVAQTLNSATSLLSCCYERYKWSTRQMKAIPLIEDDTNSDLAQLLDRRRSRGRDRVSQLVRIASICLRDSQASDNISVNSDERIDSMRSPTESIASGSSLDRSEPEGMLSLIIVESIDNWKRNAEMALEVATQQSTPSNMSEESLVQTARSLSQHGRHDYKDNGYSGVKHSIQEEEPCGEKIQTASEQTVTSLFNQERRSYSYDIHTGPDTFSIRRKPPSRYSSDHLIHKSFQTNNMSPPRSHNNHPSPPTSQSSQSSQGPPPPPMTPPPPPPSSITQQIHNSNTQPNPEIYSPPNSPLSTYASRVLQGTPVTSGTARLVHLAKSSPTSNSNPSSNLNQHPYPASHSSSSSSFSSSLKYGNASGLNISHRGLPTGESPRSNSSETIVCPSGSLGSRTSHVNLNLNLNADSNSGLKRISRGRAWLERQVEAH